jgi:hypothetical protein
MSVETQSSVFNFQAACEAEDRDSDRAATKARWKLNAIVAELRRSREVTHNIRPKGRFRRPPSLEAIAEGLAASLFPAHYGGPDLSIESLDYLVGATLNQALERLVEQVHLSLSFASESEPDEPQLAAHAQAITRDFAPSLPSVRGLQPGFAGAHAQQWQGGGHICLARAWRQSVTAGRP